MFSDDRYKPARHWVIEYGGVVCDSASLLGCWRARFFISVAFIIYYVEYHKLSNGDEDGRRATGDGKGRLVKTGNLKRV